jgi:4-carboxymuconolactone decarboxylase
MRLPGIDLESLRPEQRALYERFAADPKGVKGPHLAFLHAPRLFEVFDPYSRFVRCESSLDGRLRELATLVVARKWRSQYAWVAHAPIAARAGLAQEVIEAIRVELAPRFAREDESAVYEFVRELIVTGFVSDERYAAAQRQLGDTGVVELVGIVGHFCTISLLLNACEIGLREEEAMPFAD